jgi:hypothetical protein
MKIRPVGAELFHADGRMEGQTDMTNLIVAFRNLANRLKELTFDPARLRKVFSCPYFFILPIYDHKNMLFVPLARPCLSLEIHWPHIENHCSTVLKVAL